MVSKFEEYRRKIESDPTLAEQIAETRAKATAIAAAKYKEARGMALTVAELKAELSKLDGKWNDSYPVVYTSDDHEYEVSTVEIDTDNDDVLITVEPREVG